MRTDVVRQGRVRLARSAGMLALAALAAGCSADATRLQDSFYTGAIPPAPIQSQQAASAQPNYGAGQPNASYGAGTTGASQTYAVATPSVSRSSLPPPPAASYSGGNGVYQQPVASAPASSPVNSTEVARTEAARALPPATAGATAGGGSYVVTSGDSVLGIARRHGVRATDLRAANGLSDDNIKIGQKLAIPGGAGAPTQSARYASLGAPPSTLQAQAAAIPAPRSAPAAARPMPVAQTSTSKPPLAAPANPVQATPAPVVAAAPAAQPAAKAPTVAAAPTASESVVATAAPATTVAAEEKQEQAALAPASTGISQFRWPVQGRVIKNFGDKVGSRRNDGLNISVPRGTPVKAAENGVVIYAGEGLKEFGKTVLVKHDNGLVTVYGHADDIKVQRGATVKRGEEIATAGMTGDAEAPMLHFEVRKDSSPVNPMTYLR